MATQAFVHNAVGTTGVAEAGARLRGFVQGTTTPRTLYTNSGLSVAATFPYVADAAGHILVYYDDALDWTFQVKTANDASTLLEVDVVSGVVSITYADLGNFNSFQDAIADFIEDLTTSGIDATWVAPLAATYITPQPVDATLSAIAALGLEDGKVILGTGVDTASNVVPGALPVIASGTSNITSRTLAIRTSDVINLEDTALVFDDAATDNATLLATLIEEAADAGKKLYAPRPRVLWVENCAAFPEGDVIWQAVPGFIIKGLASGSGPVLEIDGGAFRPRLYIDGMHIDNSECTFVSAGQSGTALSLKRMSDMDIRRFIGQSTDDYRDEKGDSAITIQECRGGRIWGPVCIGQPDLGIYVTGGALTNSTDDFADIEIYGPRFYRCDGAFSSKRQGRRCAIFGGIVEECRVGFSTLEADSGGTEIDPGVEMYVAGTRFKRIGSRALHGRGDSRITGYVDIEDFGFDPDNAATPFGHTYAVRLEGPSHCDITATIRQRDWSGAGLQAFDIRALTLDSGTYTPKCNRIKATILDVATGILENAGVSASNYDLMVDGVTTPVTLASGSTSKVKLHDEDGVEWGTNWSVLKNTAVPSAHTGDTNETVEFTATIPGGYLGPNGRVRVKVATTYTNSANNKTIRVRLGGLAGAVVGQQILTTTASSTFEFDFANNANQAIQVGGVAAGIGGYGAGSAASSGTINTANDQDLVVTAQLANSGETITITSVCVEILYGA
jgi:hypothetical protein